jgi:hypothetical protein
LKGATFHGDIEGDFFLTDPLDEDEDEEENDEGEVGDPNWTDQDPVLQASAIASLDHLKTRPRPIGDLFLVMEPCNIDGGVRKLVG